MSLGPLMIGCRICDFLSGRPGVIFSTVKHILLDCTRRVVFMHVHPEKTKALEQYLAARN